MGLLRGFNITRQNKKVEQKEVVHTKRDELSDAFADLTKRAKATSDIRFQAALRLTKRQKGSTYIISLLSLFVIALSLIPNILALQNYQNQILLACSIILSVFIIFSSIIDGSQNFFHQAELLRECARKVETVYLEAKFIDIVADPVSAQRRLEELRVRYQDALDECSINHDPLDYFLYKNSKIEIAEFDLSIEGKSTFYIICRKIIRKGGGAWAYMKIWVRVMWAKAQMFSWQFPYWISMLCIVCIVYVYVIRGSNWAN